jgi:hypothetical protein
MSPVPLKPIVGVGQKIVAVARDRAVDIRPGSRRASGVAGAVGRGVAANDRVLQSHTAGVHADAATSTLGHRADRLVNSRNRDTAAAALSVREADRSMLDIHSRRVVGNSAALRDAALAVRAEIEAAAVVGLSAVCPTQGVKINSLEKDFPVDLSFVKAYDRRVSRLTSSSITPTRFWSHRLS